VDEVRISPAGDGFYAAAKHRPSEATDETAHGCYAGWVYLGYEREDESGELVEDFERVPCRRCQREEER
jgi:hypothetical protein